MNNRKTIVLGAILLLGIGQALSVSADEASHRQEVQKLFELTQMQQKINESLDNVLALQIAQSPELKDHKTVVKEFLERHIGWQSLEDALTDMYLKEFSEQELNDLLKKIVYNIQQKAWDCDIEATKNYYHDEIAKAFGVSLEEVFQYEE